MFRRLASLSLALLLLAAPALAEVYEGRTVALSTTAIVARASGVLEKSDIQVGKRVEAGETLAELRSDRGFSSQDGSVTLIYAQEGESVSGSLLEIMPVERYTVYCTVDRAYQSVESTLVHAGETVYIKCTADGTHRAVGVITQIDGEEYRVLTVGGELYVGETVYLYRDEDFTAAQRVGIGTVVVSDTQACEAEGKLTRLLVSEGDYVQRGQLLYELDGGSLLAEAGGVVTSVNVQPGDRVQEGDIVAEMVAGDAIGVEIQADETAVAGIQIGSAARMIFSGREDEEAVNGTVVGISAIADSGQYSVRIQPETGAALSLGMSVEVRIDS